MKNRVLWFITILMLFYSCDEEPTFDSAVEAINEILDTGEIDLVNTITTSAVNPSSSTVTIDWEANEYSKEFNYKLALSGYDGFMVTQNYFDWSDTWIEDKSITFENLDEGDYTFSLKSKYIAGFESTPVTFDFTINAITGPALWIYPQKQKVTAGGEFHIYLMAEDISCDNSSQIDVFGIEAALNYGSNLSFKSSTTGSLIDTYISNFNATGQNPELIPITDNDTDANILTVTTGIGPTSSTNQGLNGKGPIIKLTFDYEGSDPSATISIDTGLLGNPFAGNSGGLIINEIAAEKRVSGSIEVSQ